MNSAQNIHDFSAGYLGIWRFPKSQFDTYAIWGKILKLRMYRLHTSWKWYCIELYFLMSPVAVDHLDFVVDELDNNSAHRPVTFNLDIALLSLLLRRRADERQFKFRQNLDAYRRCRRDRRIPHVHCSCLKTQRLTTCFGHSTIKLWLHWQVLTTSTLKSYLHTFPWFFICTHGTVLMGASDVSPDKVWNTRVLRLQLNHWRYASNGTASVAQLWLIACCLEK